MKPGYKQTEVGVIPEDWEAVTINQIFQFKQGVQSPVERQAYVEREGYKRFIRIIDLTDPSVPRRYIADPGAAHHVAPKDLFMVRYGSPGLLGFGLEGVIANNLFRLIPKRKIAANFYYQYLEIRRGDIADISGSSTMPAVNFSALSGLKLVYPPLPEQRAIAEALSDVDALLASLDRLIAKKRDLKQAAMQQLLTGKTRLPGFNGEWKVKRLGEVAEIVMGQSPSSANYNTTGMGLPLIQGNADIDNRKTISRNFTTQITKRGKSGDIVMSVRAPVGEISRAGSDVCLGRGVCAILYDNDFLYHYLIYLEPTWARHSKGSTFDSVNSADVKAVEVNLPPSLLEQTAIAEVLSDMDSEITALEQRRDKTRDLKQGMMQELLTGRTRLV